MYPNPQDVVPLPARPDLAQYRKQAKDLSSACKTRGRDGVREWAKRWMADAGDQFIEFAWTRLSSGSCALSDAQFAIARAYGFLSWPTFVHHVEDLRLADGQVSAFEAAADAIVAGDRPMLERLLAGDPSLIRVRSTHEHRSTLLHYVAANGVENYRQKTPKNVVEIADVLLRAGSDVDAGADMYGGDATTLGLAATSIHPLRAGVQNALIDLLLDYGADMEHRGGSGRDVSIVNGCLANGRGEAAAHLARRGATLDLESACGVGRLDLVERYFNEDGTLQPGATAAQMRDGFGWACEFGRTDVVDYLLQKGFDVATKSLRNHGQTGLHWAASSGHADVVRLLLDRGAPLEAADESFDATPLSWALYGWSNEPRATRERYYPVVSLLVEAGARVKSEWIEHPEIRADERMVAALTVRG